MFTNKDQRKTAEKKSKKEVAKPSQHPWPKNTIGFLWCWCPRQTHAVSMLTPLLTPTVLFSQESKRTNPAIESVRKFNEKQAHSEIRVLPAKKYDRLSRKLI